MRQQVKQLLKSGFLVLAAMGCASVQAGGQPLETVPYVDLSRYVGKWYEIASFPQRFQKGCVASTATYTLNAQGEIDVLNECRMDSFDGEYKSAKGHAKVVDTETNAKLKVTFFWPFYGKYWIIDLGAEYEFAVVGHPDRDYLWILSRSPKMDEEVLRAIVSRIEGKGYDVSRLRMTPQP